MARNNRQNNNEEEEEEVIVEIPYQGSLLTRNAEHASNRAYDNVRLLPITFSFLVL